MGRPGCPAARVVEVPLVAVGDVGERRGAGAAGDVLSGHPVVRSLASDEDWAWCFADEVFLVHGTENRSGRSRQSGRAPG
ncbi:hypothetical protein [Streptomyces sp. E-08]|uniref:hypothetical protein n=1 Tax=Streptomyces sp. E-08 TaxID=3404047 RepID=UPI003CF8742D